MKVGIQFFSVRKSMEKDPMGTMERIAEIGYKNWEICQLFGHDDMPYNYGLQLPPAEGKALVERLGVNIIGSHLSSENLLDEKYMHDFYDYMEAIHCYSPGLASAFFKYGDEDDVKRRGELFNQVGRECQKRGMVFHYHNHFHEFQQFNGKYVLDLIMEYTDPELVKLELDTYWAMRGGMDPVALIHHYGDRIIMLHQKDFPKNCDIPINMFDRQFDIHGQLSAQMCAGSADPITFAEVGTGIMDIQSIIDAANLYGVKYITLEQDQTQLGELKSIETSMNAFHKYTGLEWG